MDYAPILTMGDMGMKMGEGKCGGMSGMSKMGEGSCGGKKSMGKMSEGKCGGMKTMDHSKMKANPKYGTGKAGFGSNRAIVHANTV